MINIAIFTLGIGIYFTIRSIIKHERKNSHRKQDQS